MENRGAWAQIDLSVLRKNFRGIQSCLGHETKLCSVVKANAYGHGAVPTARVAVEEGAAYLAVATVDEATQLRRAGFTEPILVLGLAPHEAVAALVLDDITATVTDLTFAEALNKEALRYGRRARVHIALETGMGRIGIYPEDAFSFASVLGHMEGIEVEGVFSHFAMADSSDKSYAAEQIRRFEYGLAELARAGVEPEIRHIAESAATLEIPETHYDMVRAGIIQYGLMPSSEVHRPDFLEPALSLYARVSFLKIVQEGQTIGYGRAYTAERDSMIATLPIGYADGYIRAYGGGYVMLHDKKAPIVGRICMDQLMIDVTDISRVRVGDVATLIGAGVTADDLAALSGSINYEVPCLLTSRIPRIYKP